MQPRLRNLNLSPQQAIEDLQCEEEKVNLLTKEKTKLQMQAEDVSSSSVCISLFQFGSQCFIVLLKKTFILKIKFSH